MRETGIVIKNEQGELEIRMQPGAACESCGLCHLDPNKLQVLHLQQQIEAHPGDVVELEVNPGFAIKSAILLFFLPLVALLVGYFLFLKWLPFSHLLVTYQGIIGGLLAMVLVYTAIHFYDRRLQKKIGGKPVRIIRVGHS